MRASFWKGMLSISQVCPWAVDKPYKKIVEFYMAFNFAQRYRKNGILLIFLYFLNKNSLGNAIVHRVAIVYLIIS